MADNLLRPRLSILSGFLLTSAFADATIKCEKREFKVHKIVLAAQSEYFAEVFKQEEQKAPEGEPTNPECEQTEDDDTPRKKIKIEESDYIPGAVTEEEPEKEADNVIDLTHGDPIVIEAMLQFMYTSDYDASISKLTKEAPLMTVHAWLYSVGHKYRIEALKIASRGKFEQSVKNCLNHEIFDPEAIAMAYKFSPSTEPGLRETVIAVAAQHLPVLENNSGFKHELESNQVFYRDMVKYLLYGGSNIAQSGPKKYKCSHCLKYFTAMLLPDGMKSFCPRCGFGRKNWSKFFAK